MMLTSLELSTTYQSNSVLEQLALALAKEMEAPAESLTQEKKLQPHPLPLGKTYLNILEAGGHLGC